jgi:ankyrin repeat protein
MAACVSDSNADLVRALLKIPAVLKGIDSQDRVGRNALMVAAAAGQTVITGILLYHKANRLLVDADGMTAQDHAGKNSYGVMLTFMSQQILH